MGKGISHTQRQGISHDRGSHTACEGWLKLDIGLTAENGRGGSVAGSEVQPTPASAGPEAEASVQPISMRLRTERVRAISLVVRLCRLKAKTWATIGRS